MYVSLLDFVPVWLDLYLNIILKFLGLVIALGSIVAFMRKRKVHVPRLKKTVALVIGGSYLWAFLAILSWGIVSVYAVQQPTFLTLTTFMGHAIASAAFLSVTVVAPGLVIRRVLKHLTSEPPKSVWFYGATPVASISRLMVSFFATLSSSARYRRLR